MYKVGGLASLVLSVALIVGCDWTSKSDGFNTSRGRGNINFSGTYNGNLSGGRAVSQTTGGNIIRLVVSQQADALEVLDNNGSRYRGRIGSVAVVNAAGADAAGQIEDSPFDAGGFPEGTQLAQAQVSWAGHDNVAAKGIEFVGTISAVAVTDIRGQATSSRDTTTDTRERESETVVNDGTNTTITITATQGPPGNQTVSTTTVTIDNETGKEINRTVVTERIRESISGSEFVLTPQNTQYRLQGTWIEQGGVVANVDALSAGAAGSIVVGAPPAAATGAAEQ